MNKLYFYSFLLLSLAISSCSKDNSSVEPENSSSIVNMFVYEYMQDGYLWNDKISSAISPKEEKDPFNLLDKMIFKGLDRWTYLTDDYSSAMDEFEGINTTFGYSLAFTRFSNSNNVFATVRYVYKDSPAERAGIKRGDIILSYANASMTIDNYLNLYYSSSVNIKMGKVVEDGGSITIRDNGVTHSLTATKIYEDPVNYYSVIENSGKKIGYLVYTNFVYNSHDKLNEVFGYFKQEGVSDLILDLRYNLGGDARTPPFLASFIAPYNNVKNGDVFLYELWNEGYMEYYKQKNTDLNVYFNKNCINNLNLSRVFILTTGSSASASEATISGLKPYLDVVLVGEKTYGKYCGAGLIGGENYNASIKNWLLSMVIYKFVNKDGFTDFVNGIDVNYLVNDNRFFPYQFGDVNDPITAEAISLITGVKATKAAKSMDNFSNIESLPNIGTKKLYGYDRIINF